MDKKTTSTILVLAVILIFGWLLINKLFPDDDETKDAAKKAKEVTHEIIEDKKKPIVKPIDGEFPVIDLMQPVRQKPNISDQIEYSINIKTESEIGLGNGTTGQGYKPVEPEPKEIWESGPQSPIGNCIQLLDDGTIQDTCQ